MAKKFKIILFIFLFALLWIPLIQQKIKFVKESELKGAYIKPEFPSLTVDSIKSLEFQKQFEDYQNFNFGFRPFFVKMKNSINYLLFHELSIYDNIAGKDNYIFSLGSTERTLGLQYSGKEKNNEIIKKIEFLKNGIEKHGGHFLVLIAPSKESVIPDYLPRPYNSNFKANTDYLDFVEGYKKYNIPVIDYCAYFNQIKETHPYPLYTKTGFHWSMYGGSIAQDTLLSYIETNIHKSIPSYKRLGVEFSETARETDADFEDPLNLLFSLGQSQYVYPKLQLVQSSTKRYRPKAIFIGDSFFWQIKRQNMLKHVLSDDSKFWFYFDKTSYSFQDNQDVPMNNLDIIKELESADFVILIGNMSTMGTFPFGVSDYYFNHYNSNNVILNGLKNVPSLMDALIKKSKNTGVSIDTLINNEATRVFQNKINFNLKGGNGNFISADETINNNLIANRNKPGLWETFSLYQLDDKTIIMNSHANKFLSCELNSKEEISATRQEIGAWEIFKLVELPDSLIAIQAINGKYLSLDEKTNIIFAKSSTIGKNEKFKLIPYK
jgi:hypothetical protein